MSERKIPTEQEIAKLPRWAIVAFAARCAIRVEPAFKYYWPEASNDQIAAVKWAIDRGAKAANAEAADARAKAVKAVQASNSPYLPCSFIFSRRSSRFPRKATVFGCSPLNDFSAISIASR